MNALDKKKELTDQLVRDEIHKAAVSVLEEHGLSGMTMDRVAETAGVAKGTLYNYFKNKDALFSFTHQKLFEDHWKNMESIRGETLPPVDKLKTAVLAIFTHFSINKRVMLAIHEGLSSAGGPRKLMKTHGERAAKITSLFAELIRTGMKDGVFRPLDDQFAAEMLLSSIIGKIKRCAMEDRKIDPEHFTDAILDIFLKGIQS